MSLDRLVIFKCNYWRGTQRWQKCQQGCGNWRGYLIEVVKDLFDHYWMSLEFSRYCAMRWLSVLTTASISAWLETCMRLNFATEANKLLLFAAITDYAQKYIFKPTALEKFFELFVYMMR
jgi:hypothetical protein